MCTVSWLREGDSYQVFCNRDEKRTRRAARAPQVHELDGVRSVAPVDGDFGGTWIFANEHGVAACLLNGRGPQTGRSSRGMLLSDASAAVSAQDLIDRIAFRPLKAFSPFTVIAFEPTAGPLSLDWDGVRRLEGEPRLPLTSSSYQPDAVTHGRLTAFERLADRAGRIDERLLLTFHRSHEQGPGPESVCMHRDDAETVSFSRLVVGPRSVDLSYSPSAPCRSVPAITLSLPRMN